MQAIAFFMSPRSYIRLACMTFLASVLAAYWAVFIPKVHPVMRCFIYLAVEGYLCVRAAAGLLLLGVHGRICASHVGPNAQGFTNMTD